MLNRLGLKAGKTVLIHGGSGGVGSLGIQIAVAMGASVIATASEKNHEFLRSLGAEPVAYGDRLADRVRALRRKIDKPFGRTTLVTVRGAGYRLEA